MICVIGRQLTNLPVVEIASTDVRLGSCRAPEFGISLVLRVTRKLLPGVRVVGSGDGSKGDNGAEGVGVSVKREGEGVGAGVNAGVGAGVGPNDGPLPVGSGVGAGVGSGVGAGQSTGEVDGTSAPVVKLGKPRREHV